MEPKTISKKDKILSTAIASIGLVAFFCYLFFDFFAHQSFMLNPEEDLFNRLAPVIIACVFGLLLYILHVLNLYVFKIAKAYKFSSILSSGLCFFFVIALIISSISYSDKWQFDVSNISLFTTASFTLLGFGLTITAIMAPFVMDRAIKTLKSNEIDLTLFNQIIIYLLLFGFGLIFTISSLLNIQFADQGYYKIRIFQGLLFSSAQILMIVVELITLFVKFLMKETQK